jgi:hypothetical protein
MDAQGMLAPNTRKVLCKCLQLQWITCNVYQDKLSPAISIKSLPDSGTIVTHQPQTMAVDKEARENEVKPIAVRPRSKTMFK